MTTQGVCRHLAALVACTLSLPPLPSFARRAPPRRPRSPAGNAISLFDGPSHFEIFGDTGRMRWPARSPNTTFFRSPCHFSPFRPASTYRECPGLGRPTSAARICLQGVSHKRDGGDSAQTIKTLECRSIALGPSGVCSQVGRESSGVASGCHHRARWPAACWRQPTGRVAPICDISPIRPLYSVGRSRTHSLCVSD